MQLKNNIPEFDILAAYFAGEATAEDIKLVEEWINSGNIDEFNKIKNLWLHSDIAVQDFDTEAALQKINLRIEKSKPRRTLRFISIAAAVIIAIISIPLIIINFGEGLGKNRMLSFNSMDSISQIELTDGSVLTLNNNSSIEYPKDFDKNRNIKLKGEAYFEIAHIDNTNKFTVDAGDIEITVIGTKFNIKAYESSNFIEVSVTEGVVKVSGQKSDSFIELHANQRAVFNKKTLEITKDSVSAQNEIFWKTNTISFKDSDLKEIASTLSKIYNIEVEVNIENHIDYKINTVFTGNSLTEIIKILELTLDIKIRQEQNRLIFEEK